MSPHSIMKSPGNGTAPSPPPTEVAPTSVVPSAVGPRVQRRSFPAAYKRRLLHEADQCSQSGQVGALLRREGLYSSHLSTWRQQRERGELGLSKRGQPPADPARKEVVRLRGENERLRQRLAQAEAIIAVQKKLSDLLGLACDAPAKGGSR